MNCSLSVESARRVQSGARPPADGGRGSSEASSTPMLPADIAVSAPVSCDTDQRSSPMRACHSASASVRVTSPSRRRSAIQLRGTPRALR